MKAARKTLKRFELRPSEAQSLEPQPLPAHSLVARSFPVQPSAAQSATQPFMRACRIVVKPDRLVCDIAVSPGCPRVSSPALLGVLLKQHPALPHHACKNSKGTTFVAVMNKTAIIHVLEHVAIDCMVQQAPCSSKLFIGNSQWVDQKAGTGRVVLNYHDDVAALNALNTAIGQLNEALSETVSK